MVFSKKKIATSKKWGVTTNIIASYESVRKKNSITAFLLGSIAVLAVACIGSFAFALASGIKISIPVPNITSLPSFIPSFSFKSDDGVFGGSDKINVLLTGIGGGNHDGGELTDTIMLTSINKRTNTVSMLSVPRDLYVEYPTGGKGKLNETYFRAYKQAEREAKSESKTSSKKKETTTDTTSTSYVADGMAKLGEKMTEITGEKVDKFVNIDFAGFEKFVDLLGGVTIDVPEDLVDREYPDNNWGYQTFSIKKGLQTLNGSTALKYARSRHSTNDFDRSLRQQLIIRGIKDKLFSLGTLTSPTKLKSLYDAISTNIRTDLSISDMISLAVFAKSLPSQNILSFNLNDSCFQSVAECMRGGFLYTPLKADFGGASVLLPDTASAGKISNYSEISRFANLVFNYPELFLENIEINITNSTKLSGIANDVALYLKKFGFNVPDKYSISSTKDIYNTTQTYYVWDAETKSGIDPSSKTLEVLNLFGFTSPEAISTTKYAKIPGAKIEIVLAQDIKKLLK